MPLLGTAAMLLSFDVAAEAVAEHDDWHTQEHLPERLSIPGFLRGSRWIGTQGQPRYLVLYEVAALATLTSAAYLERLNHPSEWTRRIMPHYRGMKRGFCAVSGGFGSGLGHAALLVRLGTEPGAEEGLRRWLLREALPALPSLPGVGSVHLLEGAATPPMTNEQRIRGAADAGIDWALLVTGYRPEVLEEQGQAALGAPALQARGATGVSAAMYRFDYSVSQGECSGP